MRREGIPLRTPGGRTPVPAALADLAGRGREITPDLRNLPACGQAYTVLGVATPTEIGARCSTHHLHAQARDGNHGSFG
jgi:hypothetical protein